MNLGDRVEILDGIFADMTGTVIRDEGDEVLIEFVLFGRATQASVARDQIKAPGADPRRKWHKRIEKGFKLWTGYLEEEWWDNQRESGEAPSADEWRDFQAFRERNSAALESERASILAQFDAEIDAVACAREDDRDLEAIIEQDAERWFKYDLKYTQVIEGRIARGKQDPSYSGQFRARGRGISQRKFDAYERYFRERHDFGTPERRGQALAAAMERYEKIRPAFEAAFGLLLPEQTARFWAFWSSLEGCEKEVADWVGRTPGGIMDWFRHDFEERELIEGLDHRLHFRYLQAPPEFVCVMLGDSDGLNYGLWYEDPAEEPTWVAKFYARDDGVLSPAGRTILEAYRMVLERLEESVCKEAGRTEEELLEPRCRLNLLREALCYFERADRPERGAQYIGAYAPRLDMSGRVATLDGFGEATAHPVALPERPHSTWEIFKAYQNQPELIQTWIDSARQQLKEGHPYPALLVGRDLHALGLEEFDEDGLELRVAAYEALGRHALAEIARLHHRHRALESVDVYTR